MPILPDDIIELIITFVDFTKEVVINAAYGGFPTYWKNRNRDCEQLVRDVKNSGLPDLEIVKVDNSKTWFITQYDGTERVYYTEDIKRGSIIIDGILCKSNNR